MQQNYVNYHSTNLYQHANNNVNVQYNLSRVLTQMACM